MGDGEEAGEAGESIDAFVEQRRLYSTRSGSTTMRLSVVNTIRL